MSFLDIIKRGAGAAASGIGNVVKAATATPTQPVEPPTPEPQDQPSKGFTLPDLDPNDPDFTEKQKIHDAIMNLDKQWTEAMPNVDYQGHYRKLAAEMKKEPKAREWNSLSKLAIALGTQDPARPYEPNSGLASMQETADKKLADERKTFEENMALRKEALSGHIRQLMDQGKFRQALSELSTKEQMGVTRARTEHQFRLDEEKAKGDTRKELARISAQSAMDRADRRLNYLKEQGAKLKLSPTDKAAMDAEYRTSGAHLADVKKQWAEGMLSDDQVQAAEEEHRQEMKRIHDHYEDRELGDRPPEAGPRTTAPRQGGMKPNSADPWFK